MPSAAQLDTAFRCHIPKSSPTVHSVDSVENLTANLKNGFKRKPSSTLGEQYLQRRSQEIHHHHVVTLVFPTVGRLGTRTCKRSKNRTGQGWQGVVNVLNDLCITKYRSSFCGVLR